jgi:inner membrane transporter RhtA
MPRPPHSSPVLPVLLLVIAMASIQAGASLAKTLFQSVGAPGAVALRTLLATVMLVLALRPWRARISPRSWRPLLVYGLALGLMNLMYYLALRRIALGVTVSLEFTGPLAVALFGSRRVLDFLWIVLAAAGIYLLLQGGGKTGLIDPAGVLFALAAGACWALYIVFGQKTGADFGAQAVALGSIIATVIVVPIGVADAGTALLSRTAFEYGLAIALLSTALPYTLEMVALTRMPARTFGVLMSIEPAFGAVAGWALLHERLTLLQWAAIALVIIASIGTTFGPAEPRQAPVPMPE